MFNSRTFENSRPDGLPVLEIVYGQPESKDEPRRFVPLKRSELKGEIVGPLARLRLIQTFGYKTQDCDKVVEALYRFPLPGDAAVSSIMVRFGQVKIRTELKERGAAEAEYNQAKQEGRQALLATRESPDVFTLRIAGLRPDEEIVVETFYLQQARSEGPGWSLRIPLTTAPRYVRSDEFTAPHAQGQPLLTLRDPGHRFALDLSLRDCGSVESPTHKIDVVPEASRRRVRLKDGEVLPDRDCVLVWRPLQVQDRSSLQVLVEDDPASSHVYFLALVAPPATFDRGRGIPREVILLVDHSGSMKGAKWQAADWAVERFLSELTARDSFALGLFHNTTRWFDQQPRAASPDAVAEAIAFLKSHTDSGGTELGVALEQALGSKRQDGDCARHVLVITDAQVTDAGRILRLADQESQQPNGRRISVLCIDAAPNSLLATELAERGGGMSRFLTSEPGEDDIATALDEVLADWSEPVLSGLRLEANRSHVEAAGRRTSSFNESGWCAVDLGDLPAGRPVWCAGRTSRDVSGELIFRLMTAKGHELATCRVKTPQVDEMHPAVKALFGARRIRGLEDLIHSGYAADELAEELRFLGYDSEKVLSQESGRSKVYVENVREDLSGALRGLLVAESLDYGLASAETAFVAVRTEPGKPVERTEIVGNALPSGWSDAMLSGMRVRSVASYSLARRYCYAPGLPAGAIGAINTSFNVAIPSVQCDSRPAQQESIVVFSGVPKFDGGQAILFDSNSTAAAGQLPADGTISLVEIRFPSGTPDSKIFDLGVCLLVYVDDLSLPRARVRLADVIRQGGKRPLNILRQSGEVVQFVLVDPAGAWRNAPPQLSVAISF